MTKRKFKILFGNLGYARGINGKLSQHILYMHRHVYASKRAQSRALCQVSEAIARENPDICCFAEIDEGSFTSAGFNQVEALLNPTHCHFDIANKYGVTSRLRQFFLTKGKSLAFIAKRPYPHEKIYFENGTKRLIYRIKLGEDVTLFFAHFSLNKTTRRKQLIEARRLMLEAEGEAIFLGDFNILSGTAELEPLLKGGSLVLMNGVKPTFKFHRRELVLDLCICTAGIARRSKLSVVELPCSDHDAILLEIEKTGDL